MNPVFRQFPNTAYYRLPTYRRVAHRKFVPWSHLILKLIFMPNVDPGPRYAAKG